MNSAFSLRLARPDDVPALEGLIPLSVRVLQASIYSSAQIEAALELVFGVDHQLINDGTFFVVEHSDDIVGCGGWSRRRAEFGGNPARPAVTGTLDPARDPARIRAFFVHPDWTRRGIARALLLACESALAAAGFCDAVLVATLAGEPLYASCGYTVVERSSLRLSAGLTLPVVRMTKRFSLSRASLTIGKSPDASFGVVNS